MTHHSDRHMPCKRCSEEHPVGVLEDGLCPPCCDAEQVEDQALIRAFTFPEPSLETRLRHARAH